jgi:prefoldin subunit 5
MRLSASSVKLTERRLRIRNREVLMSAGLELAERKVEREFDRIGTVVQRDLEGYPQVQRKVSENLQNLEEDYEKCHAIPQTLPDWVKVIDAIANIKPSGDRMVVNMLEEIHHTLVEQHKAAVERHRRDVANRHGILSRMLPVWRTTQKTLGGVQKAIANLNQRSKKIDRYMDSYQKIRNRDDMAERQLSSSSLTQFFISGLVLLVAIVGAFINFNLVALPMSEMVGGASYIGAFKVSDIAGMFIVCVEIVVGFFLMDTMRITRLFSIIGSMEDRKRKRIGWGLVIVMTVLAVVESSLAFYRDQIAADMEALRQTLAGVEPSDVSSSNIPMIGQMVMGFILPFVLAFVAIPFESFVSSSRTVIGIAASWFLRTLTFILRLFGNMGFYLSRMVVNIYDLIIFPALWLEGMIFKAFSKKGLKEERSDKADDNHIKEPATLMEEPAQCNEAIE